MSPREELPPPSHRPWWASAVFYQVYPRSFADGDGDGTGDLIGLRERLGHLRELGVDALWLSPFYRSPMADGGYDVADPCDVDPLFGTMADFDAMLAEAHRLELKVTIDIVPNHVSDRHPWFAEALAAPPGSPARERFVFRPGRGEHGELPPNNWPSVFGGPAWTRVPSGGTPGNEGVAAGGGQWYLHLFAAEQPDLNWANPGVPAEFERILRFWLDRGVDGFRIDVAHALAKPEGLPDLDLTALRGLSDIAMPSAADLRWDAEAVHGHHRRFRQVLDSYPGERMAVGEAWVPDAERLARYVRPDELNLAFNFELVIAPWGAGAFRDAINRSLDAMADVGAPCTWVLDNHDVDRAATRFGGDEAGLARARAALLVILSLPGAAYLYNGDELGLANVELPDAALRDPIWERSGHQVRGRDGERIPLPWSGTEPPYGFTTGTPWLPMPEGWVALTAEAQWADPDSTLNLTRAALRLRRDVPDLTGPDFAWALTDGVQTRREPAARLHSDSDSVLAYRRGAVTVVLNAGDAPLPLPAGCEVLLASGPLDGSGPGQALPGNTAVWLRTA